MLSFEDLKNANSVNLGRAIIFLIELSHSQFTQTYRICNNNAKITSDNEEFLPFNFVITINAKGENTGANIVLTNVDNTFSQEIKKATGNESIVAKIWFVNVEWDGSGFYVGERTNQGEFEINNLSLTKESISGVLGLRTSIQYNASKLRYNRTIFNNLYRKGR